MVPPKETHDERLARVARDKIAAGKRTNRDERSALNRVERASARAALWESMRAVPKGVYEEMSGRQSRTLNEQAETYGIPVSGTKVDVTAVVRWIHDLFGKHGQKLVPLIGVAAKPRADFGDPLLDGVGDDGDVWLSRYREQKTHIARLERQQREGELLPREDVHRLLTLTASRLRGAGEEIQRCTDGKAAFDVLQLAIEEIEREVLDYFDGDDRTEAA